MPRGRLAATRIPQPSRLAADCPTLAPLTLDPDRIAAALDASGCITPALVIDLAQVERNIAAMLRVVGEAKRWRPHVKTIKQARIVDLLLAAGVRHFKCATIPELRMVLATAARADAVVDVLLAYPVGPARLPEVAALARAHASCRIGITADDPEHLGEIATHPELDVWLDVDVGMHRTGSAIEVWRRWASTATRPRIVGVQAYEGHLGWSEAASAASLYEDVAALGRDIGGCAWILTSGSLAFGHALASAALQQSPAGPVHQIGAGTLVLGDVASREPAAAIGADTSTYVAARVVARPGPGRVTLDAGSKAIAPDRPAPACAVLGHPTWRPLRASEEHLPIEIGDDPPPARNTIVLLVPDHVCTTVNLYRDVVYLRDGVPCGIGTIEAAGRESPRRSDT